MKQMNERESKYIESRKPHDVHRVRSLISQTLAGRQRDTSASLHSQRAHSISWQKQVVGPASSQSQFRVRKLGQEHNCREKISNRTKYKSKKLFGKPWLTLMYQTASLYPSDVVQQVHCRTEYNFSKLNVHWWTLHIKRYKLISNAICQWNRPLK